MLNSAFGNSLLDAKGSEHQRIIQHFAMNDNASLYALYVLFCWLAVNLVLIVRGMRKQYSLLELLVIVTLVSALFAIAATAVRINNT